MKHETLELKGKVISRSERKLQRIGSSYFGSLPIFLVRSIWNVLNLPLQKRILEYTIVEDEDTKEKILIIRFLGKKKIDERGYPYSETCTD